MNILHLLSQNHLTGSEVYAIKLIEHQLQSHHVVHQMSNAFFRETPAKKWTVEVETRSKFKFWKNVFFLRALLKTEKIHVLHTHSRASAKLAYWARLGLRVGMVSTVHGRQHPSFSKKIMNQYGDFLFAVCENIKAQLIQEFKYPERRVKLLRNSLSEVEFKYLPETAISVEKNFAAKKIKIAVIGRTTGPKGMRTQLILNALAPLLKKMNITAEYFLVGGNLSDLQLTENISVQQINPSQLTSKDYQPYDVVVGSGRVALESLLTGIPTLVFGEASYQGLARVSSLAKNYENNFGDIEKSAKLPTLNLSQLEEDVRTLFSGELTESERKKIAETIRQEFDTKKLSRKIMRTYESAYFLRNYSKWIPILMYHKIPHSKLESQHKIFVTAKNFEQHLKFFKAWGFTTITFNELQDFKSARKDFSLFPKKPLLLTFDDGYVDNLEIASPLLKKYGFKAQLFLLANAKINSNEWDHSPTEKSHQIVAGNERQKWKSSAFVIGSHGFSHERITAMEEEKARAELRLSKQELEKEFGANISVYAFTYGDTNLQMAQMAFDEGYDYAVNTDSGGLLIEEDPYCIFRVNIFPDETFFSLFKKTSSWYRKYYFNKRKK